MRLVGCLRLVERTLARIGHRQRARDHQRLGEAVALARRQHDPADARVERQAGELAPDVGQRAALVDGAELGEQLVAVGYGARARRFDERERVDRSEVERRHLQNHARERAAQDFRLGKARTRRVIGLRIEAHADAVLHAPAASRALVGIRLRDLLDLEERRPVARRIALDAREPGVDHVADARDGERGLGDVGREHDASAARRGERALLLLGRQARIQRQDLRHRAPRTAPQVGAQPLGGLANLALAGKERQDVAGTCAPQVARRVDDRLLDVLLVVGGLVLEVASACAVADLDRVQPAGHLDDRRGMRVVAAEMAREPLGVERRRRDHELEVVAPRQQLLQVAEQEVDVEAALVRLVDDDRVVGQEVAVAARLGQQDAVGHHLDPRARRAPVGEAHLVADRAAERAAHLLRDARRDAARREPPRLRMPDQPARPAPGRDADLGKLRRLPRAGLAADDDDRMRANRGGDLVGALRDRQLGGIGEARTRREPRVAPRRRALDLDGDAPPRLGTRPEPARLDDARGEAHSVGDEQVRKARGEVDRGRGGGSHGGAGDAGRGRRGREAGADSTVLPRGATLRYDPPTSRPRVRPRE